MRVIKSYKIWEKTNKQTGYVNLWSWKYEKLQVFLKMFQSLNSKQLRILSDMVNQKGIVSKGLAFVW